MQIALSSRLVSRANCQAGDRMLTRTLHRWCVDSQRSENPQSCRRFKSKTSRFWTPRCLALRRKRYFLKPRSRLQRQDLLINSVWKTSANAIRSRRSRPRIAGFRHFCCFHKRSGEVSKASTLQLACHRKVRRYNRQSLATMRRGKSSGATAEFSRTHAFPCWRFHSCAC